jgi:hypothetical protein
VGSKVTVWILEAELDENKDDDPWNGCTMSVLWQGFFYIRVDSETAGGLD